MSRLKKIFLKVMSGQNDNNISFSDICCLLDSMGFFCRIKGSHHIYYKDGVDEIINIQPAANKTKVYQVKQIRDIILKYKLGDF